MLFHCKIIYFWRYYWVFELLLVIQDNSNIFHCFGKTKVGTYVNKNTKFLKGIKGFPKQLFGLFWEETSACAAAHTYHVMDVCNHAQSHNSFASDGGTLFVLVALKRLNVNEPKHWETWSHRTCLNFPFLRGKIIHYLNVFAEQLHF